MNWFDLGAPRLSERLCAADIDYLRQLGTRGEYRDGQLVHSRGDATDSVGLVLKGAVQVGRRRRDGRQIIVHVAGEGDVFGPLMDAGEHMIRTHDAVAVGDTEIAHLEQSVVEGAFAARPSIMRGFLSIYSARVRLLAQLHDDARLLPPVVRVGKLLLQLAAAEAGPLIQCRQEELMRVLGVSSVTLSAALKSLVTEGWIATGYRSIRIVDHAGLSAWVAREDG